MSDLLLHSVVIFWISVWFDSIRFEKQALVLCTNNTLKSFFFLLSHSPTLIINFFSSLFSDDDDDMPFCHATYTAPHYTYIIIPF